MTKAFGTLIFGTLLSSSVVASPPQAHVPLTEFVGKYPSDKVRSLTFLTHPTVKRAVMAATWEPLVVQEVLGNGVTDRIQRRGAYLVSSSCRPHNCDTVNWTIVIRTPNGPAAVCYHNENLMGEASRWFVNGNVTIQPVGGCDWFKVPNGVLSAL